MQAGGVEARKAEESYAYRACKPKFPWTILTGKKPSLVRPYDGIKKVSPAQGTISGRDFLGQLRGCNERCSAGRDRRRIFARCF